MPPKLAFVWFATESYCINQNSVHHLLQHPRLPAQLVFPEPRRSRLKERLS